MNSILKSLTLNYALKCSSRNWRLSSHLLNSSRCFTNTIQEKARQTPGSLDRYIEVLDNATKRFQNVYGSLLEKAIVFAESQETVNGAQLNALLRTTGNYLRDLSPEDRDKLTERIWKLTEESAKDISQFNTLLAVKIENGIAFDPRDVLNQISAAGLKPNLLTYQRLVDRYCEMGQTDEAKNLIEVIKNQNSLIPASVFHSLIKGHFQAGNEIAAAQVLETMRSRTVAVTADTYTVLACGYAKNGKINKAIQTVDAMQLSDSQVLEVFKSAVLGSKKDSLKECSEILTLLPQSSTITRDLQNTSLELISLKRIDAALLLNQSASSSSAILVPLAKCDYPVEEVVKLSRQYEEKSGFLEAARIGIYEKDKNTALAYIQALHDEKFEVRPHYYLPCICACKTNEEIFQLLSIMYSNKTPATLQIIYDFVSPRLNFDNPQQVFDKLVNAGYVNTLSLSVVVNGLLASNQLEKCGAFLAPFKTQIDSTNSVEILANITTSSNLGTSVQILEKFSRFQLLNQRTIDVVAKYLNSIDPSLFEEAAKLIAQRKLRIDVGSYIALQENGFNVSYFDSLTVDERPTKSHLDKSVDELESHVIELRSKKMNTRGTLRKLILNYCRDGQFEKAEAAIVQLGEANCTGAIFASMVEMYTGKGDIEKALVYYQKVIAFKGFQMDAYKLVDLATLLIKKNRLPEAKELLLKRLQRTAASIDRNMNALVEATTVNYGVEEAMDLIRDCVSKVTEISSKTIGAVISETLKTDLQQAVNLYIQITQEFRKPVLKNTILRRLIIANDEGGVKRIIEATAGIQSRPSLNFDLAMCYLECDKVDKAKIYFKIVGMKNSLSRFTNTCNHLASAHQWDKLESFLTISEQLGVNQSYINAYRDRIKNKEKTL